MSTEPLNREETVDEGKIVTGRTVKKKFFAALAAGFLLLGGMAAVFGISGSAFAMPMGGMGDFYVKFNKLEGHGFTMLPHVGETGNSDKAPMVRNKIDSATVYGLHIYKDVKIPGIGWKRVNIKASKPVTIKGLIQDARFVSADLSFNDLALKESNTDDFRKNFMQTGKDVTIKNANIVTDYLFQSAVTLNGTKITITDSPGHSK